MIRSEENLQNLSSSWMAISQMALIFDVAGRTEGANESILDKMESELHRFMFIRKIVENNHVGIVRGEVEPIRIHSSKDTDAIERKQNESRRSFSVSTCNGKKRPHDISHHRVKDISRS